MNKIAIVLAGLACAGMAQRAHTSNKLLQDQALAKLLTTYNPAAAFHQAGAQPQLQAGTPTQKRFAHPTNQDFAAEKTLATPSHTDKFMREKPTPEYDYFEPLFTGDFTVKDNPMIAADLRNKMKGRLFGKELFDDLKEASKEEQDKVATDLIDFVEKTKTDIELYNDLENKAQRLKDKENFMRKFCADNKYGEKVTEKLAEITKKGRWQWIGDAADSYTEYLRYQRKELPCSVVTGSEDLMPQIEAMCKKLATHDGFTPVIEYEVDPKITGYKLVINGDVGYDFTEEAKQRRLEGEFKKVLPLMVRELLRKKLLKKGLSEEELEIMGFAAKDNVDWRNLV